MNRSRRPRPRHLVRLALPLLFWLAAWSPPTRAAELLVPFFDATQGYGVVRLDSRTGAFLDYLVSPGSGPFATTGEQTGVLPGGDLLAVSAGLQRFQGTTGDYLGSAWPAGRQGIYCNESFVVAGEARVLCSQAFVIHEVDLDEGTRIRTLPAQIYASLLALSPDGNRLFVAGGAWDGQTGLRFAQLVRLDLGLPTVSFSVEFRTAEGFWPNSIAATEDQVFLLGSAESGGGQRLIRFDAETGEALGDLVPSSWLPPWAQGILVEPSGELSVFSNSPLAWRRFSPSGEPLGDVQIDPPASTLLSLSSASLRVDPPDDTLLWLGDGRFRVEGHWTTATGLTGPAHAAAARTSESGLLWFFDKRNWEVQIKILDGCGVNGHFWVLGSATTDVAYELSVTDTQTGAVWAFSNPLGRPSPAFIDVEALATCP